MTRSENQSDETQGQSLGSLTQQKADLESQVDEHTRYLNEVAAYFSSGEEQQRIVSDICDFRKAIARIDQIIATLPSSGQG